MAAIVRPLKFGTEWFDAFLGNSSVHLHSFFHYYSDGGLTDLIIVKFFKGPPKGNHDGVSRHKLERDNGNWINKMELFCSKSNWLSV